MIITADTSGSNGVYVDPVWRVEVALTPVEQALLRTWWVRRLGFVSHAGAAVITTAQTYTRLEHSLGLLALVAHFRPDDHVARVAALVHDVGHLPFSHTLEHLGGLDHHELGAARIRDLAPVLQAHGYDAETVIAVVDGVRPSGLRGSGPGLRLDHLESFVRSGHAHGRTGEPPRETLERLRLIDGVIDTDAATAGYLRALIIAEAHAQTADANLVPVAVLRELAGRVLDPADPSRRDQIAALTDDGLWSLLLGGPATRDDAERLRRAPWSWRTDPTADGGLEVRKTRYYLELPTVDGVSMPPLVPAEVGLPELPYSVRVVAEPVSS
ncbi:hypothetical protein FHX74_003586 [Friedmanniella endophytica]|uniref:HD domain-containing protein n=1 Tax=Microlunatus kandeliicorticis TaxID=1759536 RepID=A0A7W3P7F9_9ACTN|nr:HD domain-containing protein [Microlunatus kandeliicorticis]MBA8795945.1 hypothetical protein [Microlunatus kandeliicorticis]